MPDLVKQGKLTPDTAKTSEPEAPVTETTIRLNDSLLTVIPVGRLDTVTSAELKERIAEYDFRGCDVKFDFSNVEYISSAGLRLLVALQKQVKEEGRRMTIANINAVVREVFRISGFDKAFTVL